MAKSTEFENAWLFGDIGRPILGPASFAFLARTIPGFSEWVRELVKTTVGGRPRENAKSRLETQAKQLNELFEVLKRCRAAEGETLDCKAFVISQADDYDVVTLGNLPWTVNTWDILRNLGFNFEDSIRVLEGITWNELFSFENGIEAFFDIVQMINDWLPFAHDRELLIEVDATIDELVPTFQRELIARANFNIVGQITYHDLLQRRNGWGVQAQTLDEIGADLALTRERVRQIEAQLALIAKARTRDSWTALQNLASYEAKSKFSQVISELREEFTLSENWGIQELESLLEIICGEHLAAEFAKNVLPSIAESTEHRVLTKAVRDARSIIGVIKLDTIANPDGSGFLPVSEALSVAQEIYGKVNFANNYAIVSRNSNAGLYSAIAIQLQVCNPLHIDQIIVGIQRAASQRNAKGTIPDKQSLVQMLRQSGDFDVSDNQLVSGREQEHEPGTIQRWLLDLISSQDGAVISKAEVYREALISGVKLSSLNIYITFQPTIRPAGRGLITLVGNTPTKAQLDFANRVAEAKYVANTPVQIKALNAEEFQIEFTFSTPFFESGTVSSTELLLQMYGTEAKRIYCCPEFDAETNSFVKIKSNFLYGLASAKDHLLYHHGYSEGDKVRLIISKDSVHISI